MSDDFDFISNVKTLADNGTLTELLRRIEDVHTLDWKMAQDPAQRERCWNLIQAVHNLRGTIKGLTTDDKVREFNNRLRRAS